MRRMLWKILIVLSVVVLLVVVVCDLAVRLNARHRVYDSLDSLPHNNVGLLLGTSPVNPEGNHNLYFQYRIDAAVKLIEAGKIDTILASGASYDVDYGLYDETRHMRDSLIARGVPPEKILCDTAGFRTIASIMRAKEVFGYDSFTIISQQFHNERAIYQADHHGINAVAYNAQDVTIWHKWLKIHGRELLARVKLFIDFASDEKQSDLKNNKN